MTGYAVKQSTALPEVSARFFRSMDGGPLRTIHTGHQRHPTGTFISVKAGFRSLPHESPWEELAMKVAELSCRVFSFVSQPVRIELPVRGEARPWIYFTDIELRVDRSLVADLKAGTPFGLAALKVWSQPTDISKAALLALEVKSKADTRASEPFYKTKLKEVGREYRKKGFHFMTIEEGRDFEGFNPAWIRWIADENTTVVDAKESWLVVEYLKTCNGTSTATKICELLGGGPVAEDKLHALVARRIVALDLSAKRSPSVAVHLVRHR